ncbi:hypothetical protein [Roseovarius aestuariivivens]|uniref:hypothetical protein n=1 Tax=Roseovarius aestuariivivens TaxID=1888910 RepID=UPI00143671F4|nr:hypothetical protein [Roseovarius aestuariivivens]
MWWLILLSLAFIPPFWKLLPRYGMASAWALLAILPVGALILLYLMAFMATPKGDQV